MKCLRNWYNCIALIFCLIVPKLVYSSTLEERTFDINKIDDKTFYFDVFLGSRNIGFHNFYLKKVGGQLRVISDANMTFKAFLFKEISYEHKAEEWWEDGCLQRFSSATNRNSKSIVVNGARVGNQFVIDDENEETRYEGCIRSFAYWAPALLQTDNLINVETGKNIPVAVSIDNDGRGVFQSTTIELPKSSISLKYDSDGRWIELETRLKLFGKLKYKLTTI